MQSTHEGTHEEHWAHTRPPRFEGVGVQVATPPGQRRRDDSRPERDRAEDTTAARKAPEGARTWVRSLPNPPLPQKSGTVEDGMGSGSAAQANGSDDGMGSATMATGHSRGTARAARGAAPCLIRNNGNMNEQKDGKTGLQTCNCDPDTDETDAPKSRTESHRRIDKAPKVCLNNREFPKKTRRLHCDARARSKWVNRPTERNGGAGPYGCATPATVSHSVVMPSSLVSLSVHSEGDSLLSPKEVARRLGVCRRSLERRIAEGHFPKPMKFGTRSLFAPADVEAFKLRLHLNRGGAA